MEKDQYKDYYLKHSVLHKDPIKELIVVPALMEDEVIKIAHKQGHFSAKKTQEVVEKTFYIPLLSEGFLTPISKEDRPLETYHVDHVGPMEQNNKWYKYIFVVVDAFSNLCGFIPREPLQQTK